MNPLVLPFSLLIIVTLAFAGFGIWSYLQFADLDGNFNEKIKEAVVVREGQIRADVNVEFQEKEKLPLRTYLAPSFLGSVKVQYPKIWSVYAEETGSGSTELDVYFHPGFVSDKNGDARQALRVSLEDRQYSAVQGTYESDIEKGLLKVTTITSSGVQGVRLEGEIDSEIIGVLVLLPVRDKTLKIWTESTEFAADFNNTIMPNISFIP